MNGQGQGGQPDQQQMLQMFQQKVGNLELTANALISVLVEEGLIEEDQINEKAQELVQEMQEQQEAAEGDGPEDLR